MNADRQPAGRRYEVAAKYLPVRMDGRGLPDYLNSRKGLKKALKEEGNCRRFIAAVMRRYDRGQIV